MNNKDLKTDFGTFMLHLVFCIIFLITGIISMIRKDNYGSIVSFICFWGSRVILGLNC